LLSQILTRVNGSVNLRLARAGDAECLAAFAVHVWLHTYATSGISGPMAEYVLAQFNPQAFRQQVEDRNVQVAVAEASEGLAGFALLRYGVQCPGRVEVTTELEHLYVLPRLAGTGIGSKFLEFSCDLVGDRTGDSAHWLSVYVHNERALSFYKKHGYEHIGSVDFELGGDKHENHVFVSPRKKGMK
jgi:diamine N-acetyltransferase